MSGPNEHYLPRLIQRGFCVERPGEWVFKVTRGGSNLDRIVRVGAEDYFNSGSEEDKHIDEKMTQFENYIGNYVAQWRKSEVKRVDSYIASQLIFNLTIRNDQMRSQVSLLFRDVIDVLALKFINEKWLRKKINAAINNKDSEIRKKMRKEIIQKGYIGHALVQAEEFMIEFFKENMDRFIDQKIREFIEIFPYMSLSGVSSAASAHRKAIQSEFEGKKFENLGQLSWQVVRYEGANFILPDCAAIAVPKSGPPGSLFFLG